MLDGKSGNDAREMTAEYMRIADAAAVSRREGIGFDAFCKFYEMLVMAKARQQLRFKLGLQVEGAYLAEQALKGPYSTLARLRFQGSSLSHAAA